MTSRREALVLLCGGVSAQAAAAADSIVVHKARRTLTLYNGGQVLRRYLVALGRTPIGAKRRQGDGKTPEGEYTIIGRNRYSSYHRSLRISYPNAADQAYARRAGVSAGGDIVIHGLPNGMGEVGAAHRESDWTEGCIAVTNEEIEEIWRLVPDGTPIRIEP